MDWLLMLLGVGIFLVAIYVLLIVLVLALSLRPVRIHQYLSPGMLGYPQEDVSFETSDRLKLQGWWTDGAEDMVLICVHGYIMNRCEWVPVNSFLGPDRVSTLHFDLRAHGRSQGRKIAFGWDEVRDVEAAIKFARTKRPHAKLVLLGSSMGAVGSVLAAARLTSEVDGLILDGPYCRFDEAMKGWWPFLGGKFLGTMMKPSLWFAPLVLGYRPGELAVDLELKKVSHLPILLTYGDRDPLITPQGIQAMKTAAGDGSELFVFERATHGEGRLKYPAKFQELVEGFLVTNSFIAEKEKRNL